MGFFKNRKHCNFLTVLDEETVIDLHRTWKSPKKNNFSYFL